jgi:hypothetical protein
MRSGFHGMSRSRPVWMSSSTSRRMVSNLPTAILRFICSSYSSSFQQWNQAANCARSSRESFSTASLIWSILTLQNLTRGNYAAIISSAYSATSAVKILEPTNGKQRKAKQPQLWTSQCVQIRPCSSQGGISMRTALTAGCLANIERRTRRAEYARIMSSRCSLMYF